MSAKTDPDQRHRQQPYLKALSTVPEIEEIGRPVCLVPPQIEGSKSLKVAASEMRRIGEARLRQSQFPDIVHWNGEVVRKPEGW